MTAQSDSFYNKISFLYPVIDVFLYPQKRKLMRTINQLPSGKLLEIGVGNGSHLALYKKHEVIAIDSSIQMLQDAKKNCPPNVFIKHMNAESLTFEKQDFDYVVLSHTLTVVAQPEVVMNEIHRVLKPQGKLFILNHFTPTNYLRHLDYLFAKFAPLFHFKSVFHEEDIPQLSLFKRADVVKFKPFGYFKLVVLQKG